MTFKIKIEFLVHKGCDDLMINKLYDYDNKKIEIMYRSHYIGEPIEKWHKLEFWIKFRFHKENCLMYNYIFRFFLRLILEKRIIERIKPWYKILKLRKISYV